MSATRQMLQTIREKSLLRRGESVLLAASGGADSTAMVHLLAALREECGLTLHIIHVNHHLRESESDGDAEFVEELGHKLGIPVAVCDGFLGSSRATAGESLQAEARAIRYRLFESVRLECGAQKVATAHNRDDRAETVLVNLFRGAGVRGLGSIPYRRGAVIRPLLDLSRRAIIEYLGKIDVRWRDDSSNAKPAYDRNRIRLDIVPRIESVLGRSITDNLVKTAEVAADIDEFLRDAAEIWLAGRDTIPARGPDGLDGLQPALAREVVLRMIEVRAGTRKSVRFDQVEGIREIARSHEAKRVPIPGGYEARSEGGELLIRSTAAIPEPFEVELSVPGEVRLPGGALIRADHAVDRPMGDRHGGYVARLDASKIAGRMVVRNRVAGDRLHPLGAPGSRKLQDLFVDRKVPLRQRDSVPILADEAGILWVAGVEIAERAKLTDETTSIVEVEFVRGG